MRNNSFFPIILSLLFISSCSKKTVKMGEDLNQEIAGFLEKISVISVNKPYDVTADHLDHLNIYQKIDRKTFALLNLTGLQKFDRDLQHFILGKIKYDKNTGLLISQVTDNEATTWLLLYNSDFVISDSIIVFYDNAEGGISKYCRIQNDQIMVTSRNMSKEYSTIYTINQNGKFITGN